LDLRNFYKFWLIANLNDRPTAFKFDISDLYLYSKRRSILISKYSTPPFSLGVFCAATSQIKLDDRVQCASLNSSLLSKYIGIRSTETVRGRRNLYFKMRNLVLLVTGKPLPQNT